MDDNTLQQNEDMEELENAFQNLSDPVVHKAGKYAKPQKKRLFSLRFYTIMKKQRKIFAKEEKI